MPSPVNTGGVVRTGVVVKLWVAAAALPDGSALRRRQ